MKTRAKKQLTVALAQFNLIVGDIAYNTDQIITLAREAKNRYQADLIIFPELTVCGYPPQDLLYRSDFLAANALAVQHIMQTVTDITVIIGHPEYQEGQYFNTLSVLNNGKKVASYHKRKLPNNGVFDEKRYYTAGEHSCVFSLNGHRIGLSICEDLWTPPVAADLKERGAELIISINASPFDLMKQQRRREMIQQRAQETGLPVIYVANVGGHDDLIYDGGTCVVDKQGHIQQQSPFFEPALDIIHFDAETQCLPSARIADMPTREESLYKAIRLGLKDYVTKNRFTQVVLGVSGGIDSALVLALAVDALGAENVHALILPSRYTAAISLEDGKNLCHALNVKYTELSIEPCFNALLTELAPVFEGYASDITEQNLQARCRGILLMAYANKTGAMLLSTGNKSEIAVGYCTLYGDMAGGYAPIKDIYKMDVYALCRYRNHISPVIPERIIERAPSAELAFDQRDQDNLPPYPVLDAILYAFIEEDLSIDAIVGQGFQRSVVEQVIGLVQHSEHKRRQGPVGPKLSIRAFYKERRYPLTCGSWWKPLYTT